MANLRRISNELNHVLAPPASQPPKNPKKYTKCCKSLILQAFLRVSWRTIMQGRGTGLCRQVTGISLRTWYTVPWRPQTLINQGLTVGVPWIWFFQRF